MTAIRQFTCICLFSIFIFKKKSYREILFFLHQRSLKKLIGTESLHQIEMSNQREKFGSRLLNENNESEDVFQYNAWDNVEWTKEQIDLAQEKVRENSEKKVPVEESVEHDVNANKFWNKFYETHSDKFFKDRNWLFIDFPELISNCEEAQKQVKFERDFQEKLNLGNDSRKTNASPANEEKKKMDESVAQSTDQSNSIDDRELKICEFGCGTGSTIRTILSVNTNPKTMIYCSDFSSNAINILKNHSSYDEKRCHAFVYDCTDTDHKLPFEENSIDIILMIFTLSAICPQKMQSTITNACKYLKSGGCFLFRDYGRFDMAQLRFKNGKCISDNFYLRGDGTQAYFFAEDELEQLFNQTGLMRKEWIYVDRRLQTNRIKKLKMFRVYVQAKFIRL